MTAEVVVMNAQGMALAADSAVTITRGDDQSSKIFTSANKIFALSKYQPVAMMIYGNASLLGVPWETIVKAYRRQLKEQDFDSIGEYVDDFAKYVGGSDWLFPADVQEDYVRAYVGSLFHAISQDTKDRIRQHLDKHESIDDAEVAEIVGASITEVLGQFEDQPLLPLAPGEHEANIRTRYTKLFDEQIRQHFEGASITPEDRDRLRDLATRLFTRSSPWELPGLTGVVIAGFGGKDLFPSFNEIHVDGVAAGQLIGWTGRSAAINRQGTGAYVSAFAQGEMVTRFMEGVDPEYQMTVEGTVARVLSGYTREMLKMLKRKPSAAVRKELNDAQAEMLKTLGQELSAYRQRAFVNGVISVVAVLPLEELAHMAESLVNLTSFKRRVSMETESVAGPIDVAVISRGDGFIWIKRKHYFEPDRNPHFLANYYREN